MLFNRISHWFHRRRKHSSAGLEPDWWLRYEQKMEQAPQKNANLKDLRFVVFDTETTGLRPAVDRILSIGAIGLEQWEFKVSDALECFVRQTGGSNQKSEIEIHGILPVDRSYALDEADAMGAFVEFIGNAVLIGQHVNFDVAIVNAALNRLGLPSLRNFAVDTHRLAIRLAPPSLGYPQSGQFGLDKLCQQYGVPIHDRHTAAGDALITALLFFKLMARLEKRGVRTLGALLK